MQFSEQGENEIDHTTSRLSRARKSLTSFLWCLVVVVCAFFAIACNARAQGPQLPEPPLPVDPRPLAQLISEADKVVLAHANDPKKLVEAYLKISDTHLQAALNAIKVNSHDAAERELDIYSKALAAAAKEAFAFREGKGRRGISKKMEQTLYRQIKTLETIDRLFPGEREVFAEAALKRAKLLRVQALNEAFASGEVLKDPDAEKKPRSEPPQKESPQDDSTRPPLTLRASTLQPSPPRRLLASGIPMLPIVGSPQLPGDYLTEEEDDHVRQAQAADLRVKVFMKIADRRIKAIAGPVTAPTDKKEQKKVEEEEREWGAVPKVSRAELLRHYARAISECMAKLDDAYERNPKSSLLPKALAILQDSTDKHLQTLRALEAEVKGESEVAALREAIDEAETANKGARGGLSKH